VTIYDSVYDAQRKDLVRKALDQVEEGVFRLELFLTGYQLTGDAVEEVAEVARRLQRLARPAAVETAPPSPTAADHVVPVPPITGISRAA